LLFSNRSRIVAQRRQPSHRHRDRETPCASRQLVQQSIVIDREADMISRRTFVARGALGLAGVGLGFGHARADGYPTKPIKLIVPFAPGGPADVMARVVGQRMAVILGQSFVLENRGGAGGTIGARAAALADPDGYTLMLANTSTLVIGPAVYKSIDYDPVKNFTPVAAFGTTSNLLVVNPAVPAKTVMEFVALAKAKPGTLSYSSPGLGTPPHLIAEMFKLRTGIDIVHVPYKGGGQAVSDVVAGQVQMTFENPSVSLPLVRGGQIRALASTGEKRNPEAPDIPTMIEAGVPDFVSVSFTGLAAPAGTPADIVAKLNAAANQSLNSPDVRAVLTKLAVEPKIGSPADFEVFLRQEREKWGAVVKAANIRIE
jgi:tripartite-type tricarboxylate transporter receptor subunit TctC